MNAYNTIEQKANNIMRRHFINTVALEGYQNQVALESISMEEEQVMIDEAAGAAVEADQELAEAERIIEVSDALEDLAIIADGIEEASPAETQLVEIAGDMAVAGTDVSPEEIVPAMESFRGGKIATEGIRETAKNIWESIQRYLKQVWEKIEKFFYNILGTVPRLRKSLEALEQKVEDTVGKKAEGNVTISAGISNISIAYSPAKNEGDLSNCIGALTDAAKWTYGSHVDSVTKRGESIAKIIGEFDPAKSAEAVTAMRDALKAHKADKVPGSGSADNGRFPGFGTFVGAPLPGNKSIAYKWFADNGDDTSDLGSLDRYRNSRVELIDTSDKAPTGAKNEVEITPVTTNGAKKLIKEMQALLTVLEDYKRGPKSKAITKTQKSIEDASSKANKAMGTAKSDDEGSKAAVAPFRALLNFNAAYARWAQSPAVPLMSHSITTIKTVMVVIQKSMAAHK